ncbi:MAG: barstar family protein [Gallionellaceae bacterium]|nr:barstar family protein [Gallionellaceae bacterium]
MDNLALHLKDMNKAGTYRLGCSVEALRAAVTLAGYILFEADLTQAQGKGEFLAALARAVSAPDWFGHNFDALADALGDLTWHPASGYVLLLRNGGDTLGMTTAEHTTVMEIFGNTTAFWKSQGKPFWVFFDLSAANTNL